MRRSRFASNDIRVLSMKSAATSTAAVIWGHVFRGPGYPSRQHSIRRPYFC